VERLDRHVLQENNKIRDKNAASSRFWKGEFWVHVNVEKKLDKFPKVAKCVYKAFITVRKLFSFHNHFETLELSKVCWREIRVT